MQKKRIKRYFKKILTAVRARFETDSLMLAVEQIASFFCSPPYILVPCACLNSCLQTDTMSFCMSSCKAADEPCTYLST